jgi:uncharacterized protein (DUF58 family)
VDRQDLFKKIATFPIIASDLAEDLLAGSFSSVFKGQGIEFDEIRHYEPGDDIRIIDWNASARFGRPYVKMYREERELTVYIILDCSASMHTPNDRPGSLSRYEQALLASALIAFSADKAGQRVGAFFFDADIVRAFPPAKGRRHIMNILHSALSSSAGTRGGFRGRAGAPGSNIRQTLLGAGRFMKRRSLVILLSDFFSANWESEFEELAHRHDVIAVRISDPLDKNFPEKGLIPLTDPETGVTFNVPAKYASFRSSWAQWHEDRAGVWEKLCHRAGASALELSTAADVSGTLVRFFGNRLSSFRAGRS